MTLRAVIIDDEPPARLRLRRLLSEHPDVEIVGEAGTVATATSVIAASHPDLLLLDIRLRGATAFDLLRQLEESPLVIFTTAYDEFALEAFQVASVDYLLKPVDSEGLGRALEKVRRYHSGQRQADLLERVQRLVERSANAAPEGFLRRLGIRIGDRTLVLPVEDVTHFYAQDKLVYAATTAAKSHIVDFTLVQLARRLDPRQFIRIHRATLVNIDHVREIQRWFGGRYRVVLGDGTPLVASRNMAANLRAIVPF